MNSETTMSRKGASDYFPYIRTIYRSGAHACVCVQLTNEN